MTTPDGHELEHLISSSAHGLRNHVATIRSVVQLIDDEDVADALRVAISGLQRATERHVALARVVLDERPNDIEVTAGELVRLAAQRARREGAGGADHAIGDVDLRVTVPGTWGERLVADLLPLTDGPPNVTGEADIAVIEFPLHMAPDAAIGPALRRLAEACGGSLDRPSARVRLRLPLSAG